MSKLSHSNPLLDDVLHEGNKHLALGKKSKPIRSSPSKGPILAPRGEAAQDAFDQSFDEWCDDNSDDCDW